METVPLTDAQKKALTVNPTPAPKVRLRFGIGNLPLLKNAGVFVFYVPAEVGHKAVDYGSGLRMLLAPFSPDIASRFVCEAS